VAYTAKRTGSDQVALGACKCKKNPFEETGSSKEMMSALSRHFFVAVRKFMSIEASKAASRHKEVAMKP